MPRAVDPRPPRISHDPASRDILFDYNLFPRFDWLAWLREIIHTFITWIIRIVADLTGIDLAPIHEVIDEIIDDWINDLGTGRNILKLFRIVNDIIADIKGFDISLFIDALLKCREITAANVIAQLRGIADVIFTAGGPNLNPVIDLLEKIDAMVSAILGTAGGTLAQLANFFNNLRAFFGGINFNAASFTARFQDFIKGVLSPLNGNLWNQWRGAIMPAPHIVAGSPELLDNPNFEGAVSIASQEIWLWDPDVTEPGSARVVADGTPKTLISNPIQVTPGQRIPVKIEAQYQGLSCEPANARPIRLQINAYDWQGNLIATHPIADLASPSGNAGWTTLTGLYEATGQETAGEIDAWIAVRLDVTSAAKSGSIWFARASTKTEDHVVAQIPSRLVAGVQGIFDMGSTVQTQLNDLLVALQPMNVIAGANATFAEVAQAMHDLARNVSLNLNVLRSTRVELGLPPMTLESVQVASPGTTIIPLPIEWDYIDLVVLGGGAGGGALFGMWNGQGGGPGGFAHITLIRDGRGLPVPDYAASSYAYIHPAANTVTAFVGAGGEGGNGASGGPAPGAGSSGIGAPPQASHIEWTLPNGQPSAGVWGPAGQWGGSHREASSWNYSNSNDGPSGIGPGVHVYNDRAYIGGGSVGAPPSVGGQTRISGQPPGGGGAAGVLRVIPDLGTWGGPGAHGSVWMNAYTQETPS